VHLTKVYAKEMAGQGGGRIMQLASIASYQPTPLLAVYAATKAFVLSFSDALRFELKDHGITVTTVIPGPTDTDFFATAGMERTEAAQDPDDPAVIAGVAFDALMKGEAHAAAPGLAPMIAMSNVMPNERLAAQAHKQMLPAEDQDK
jgi:short-subunit dehydrogenase